MNDDYQSPQRGSSSGAGGPLDSDRAPVTPPIDEVFELLADDTRRRLCLYMMETEISVATVSGLVEALADENTDRDRLAIDLHHRHLPKLSAAGILEYDARSNTARYWGQPTVEKWAKHVDIVSDNSE